MAVTRKEPKDIAELGPIGIVKEALKLYAAHSKAYIVIQLGLMLPLAIVAEFFFIMQYLRPPPPETPGFLRAVHSFGNVDLYLKGHLEVIMPRWLAGELGWIATFLVFQAAFSLSVSTTLYTVGQFYAGRRVSFFSAVRAATPRLWMRLALTTVYIYVLKHSILLLQTEASLLLQEYTYCYYYEWQWVWERPVLVLSMIAAIGLYIILMISYGVSVLEEDYGWAAMKRSLKLLDGKGNVAILLPVLYSVSRMIENGLSAAILFLLKQGDFYVDFSTSDLALLLFTGVVFLAWTTFSLEFQSLCAGVQYVSFKAYHDESFSNSLYEKRTVLVECYERFGDESKVPLLKGAVV